MEIDDFDDNHDCDELFNNARGHPIEFSLSLSYEERKGVQRIVENFGGCLVGSSRGPNTIRLVPPGPVLNDRNEDLFKLQYVYDCVKHRELLDIKNYRANESQYTSDVDVMDIVLGIKSWHDATKKDGNSGEVVSDFEDDDDEESMAATAKRSRVRREYTNAERKAIVEYIVKYRRFADVKGRSMWVEMEEAKVCPHRTWESMKEHFRKVIVHRIKEFDLDVSTAKKLCRLYLKPGEMKKEFGDSSFENKGRQANFVCSPARATDLMYARKNSVEEVDENSNSEMRHKRRPMDDIDHTEPSRQSKPHDLGRVNTSNHSVSEKTSDSKSNTDTGTVYQLDETQPFSVHLSPNTSKAPEENDSEMSPNIPLQATFTLRGEGVAQNDGNSDNNIPAEGSIVGQDVINSGKDISVEGCISSKDVLAKENDFMRENINENLPSVTSLQDMQEIMFDNVSSTCGAQSLKDIEKTKEDENDTVASSDESNNFSSYSSQTSPKIAQVITQNSDVEKDPYQSKMYTLLPLRIPVVIKEELPDISDDETVIFSSEDESRIDEQRTRKNIYLKAKLFSSNQEVPSSGSGPWRWEQGDDNEKPNSSHSPQKRSDAEEIGSCTKNSFKSDSQCRNSGSRCNTDGSASPDEVIIRRSMMNRKLHTMPRRSTERCKTQKLVVSLKRVDLEKYEKLNRNGICRYIVTDQCHSEPNSDVQINIKNEVNDSSDEDCSTQDFTDLDTDKDDQEVLPRKRAEVKLSSCERRKRPANMMYSYDTEDSGSSSLSDDVNEDPFEVSDSDSSIEEIDQDSDHRKGNSNIRLPRHYSAYEDVAILNYIHRTKSHSRVGGVQIWKEMERSGIAKGRSWHSLKERYRRVLVKNLKRYVKRGAGADVISKFQKNGEMKTESKEVADMRRTYTREEDLCILDFIRRTKRYRGVTGKALWEVMSNTDPGLRGRTWLSLKERFRKIIVNNLERYGIPENEKKRFERAVGTREKKKNVYKGPAKGCIQEYYSKKSVHPVDDSSSSDDENLKNSNSANEVCYRKDRGGRIKKSNIVTYEKKPRTMCQIGKRKLFTCDSSMFCVTPEAPEPNRRFVNRVKSVTATEKTIDHPHMAGINSTSVSVLEEPAETQEMAATTRKGIMQTNSLQGNEKENSTVKRPDKGRVTENSDALVVTKEFEHTLEGHNEDTDSVAESCCEKRSHLKESSMCLEEFEGTENDGSHECGSQVEQGTEETRLSAGNHKEGTEEHSGSPSECPDSIGLQNEMEGNCFDNVHGSSENLDSENSRRVFHSDLEKNELQGCKENKITSNDTSRESVPTSSHRNLESPKFLHHRGSGRKMRLVLGQTLRRRKIRMIKLKGAGNL